MRRPGVDIYPLTKLALAKTMMEFSIVPVEVGDQARELCDYDVVYVEVAFYQ
jgi:hypothetical protein